MICPAGLKDQAMNLWGKRKIPVFSGFTSKKADKAALHSLSAQKQLMPLWPKRFKRTITVALSINDGV
jgi:hypothetical protein